MTYETLEPSEILKPFVECFWLLAAPKAYGEVPPEVVLPDGKTELIVHFGEFFSKSERDTNTGEEKFEPQAMVLLSGQLTERILLRPSGEIGVVSARFKPAGAARFFDVPYEKIVDQVIDFNTVDAAIATSLRENVLRGSTPLERMNVMQNFLLHRLQAESQEDIFVRQACRYIMTSGGEYSVSEIAKLIGFCERQLERKFKKQLGISLKTLSRIARFQKFITLSQEKKYSNLADAALSCGYYDQSHFIRDFTKFAGVSPKNYLASSHPMSDHFTSPTKGQQESVQQ